MKLGKGKVVGNKFVSAHGRTTQEFKRNQAVRQEFLLQDFGASKHHQIMKGLEQEAHEEVGPKGLV